MKNEPSLDKILEYAKHYCEKHPKRRKEICKKYRLSHSDEVKKRIVDWESKNPNLKRFISLRAAAKIRKQEFSLVFDKIYWPTHCPILGIEIDYSLHRGRKANGPSFDRIDNLKGYIPGNVRVVSNRANIIKNDGTLEEHQKVIDYLKECQKQNSLPKLLRVS